MMIMSVIMFECVTCGMNHTVGGSSGWSLSSNLSLWSASTSFFVNDSLVFNYTPDHDVVEVSKSDYATCRSTSPLSTYNDDDIGQTVILLSQPGSRYFICGRPHHCNMGLKMSVQVLYQLIPLDQTPQSSNTSSNSTVVQPGGTPVESGGSGDHDKHDPHSSHGYSDLYKVAISRYLLHLGITIMGIMYIIRLC